jgi:hypothetical protein
MSTEPLDESQPAKTEVRGGDKPSDYMPQGPSYFPEDDEIYVLEDDDSGAEFD